MPLQARVECQSHRLTFEDEPTVEYVSRFIGSKQQRYTQRGGTRPFGLAVLIAGVDAAGSPQLWSSDPSGVYYAWKVGEAAWRFGWLGIPTSHSLAQANAVGRSSKTLLEMLEKNYVEGCSSEDAEKLAVRALLDIVESGAKSIEMAVRGVRRVCALRISSVRPPPVGDAPRHGHGNVL